MQYGFVIDNRMCIGCHACTVACKSEHDVPIGVNRTHVKYIETGEFPKSSREFSVHRCNHCTDAPCVEICPTTALYTRSDGIVDFDNDRCIGCKSCMQACPYDALYIDPNTNTAAKCNYCAHKLDGGYEPACVIVCPVEAIISGDIEDPDSKISRLIDSQDTKVRKPEKHTGPNLHYIDTSNQMLDPSATNYDGNYVWSEQSKGVGHYAKYAEQKSAETDADDLLIQLAMEGSIKSGKPIDKRAIDDVAQEIQSNIDKKEARRVYDSPSKGVLWGWEVPAYVLTKAIATGIFLMMFAWQWYNSEIDHFAEFKGLILTTFFMVLTGGLLIKDLDRPDRFLYVLLRPQWKSWLVKGAYIITIFGGVVGLKLVCNVIGVEILWLWYFGSIFAVLGAIYTAFLFNQAKARDFWLTPVQSAIHMLVHAIMAGSVGLILIEPKSIYFMSEIIFFSLLINLLILFKEIVFHHDTPDTRRTVELITKGYFSKYFWVGIVIGNIIPIFLLVSQNEMLILISSPLLMLGIFLTEFVRIRVPQMIPLS